ncbi:uncharacterized protein [Dysidea avara]|uniref:uncharacterized protein n=1 Tax=Dysidea avara TaxID=196820 RepID=UPI00331EE153
MSFPCVITSVSAMPERWSKGSEQPAASAIERPGENTADVNRSYNGEIYADGLALPEAMASVQGSFSAMRLSHSSNPAPIDKVWDNGSLTDGATETPWSPINSKFMTQPPFNLKQPAQRNHQDAMNTGSLVQSDGQAQAQFAAAQPGNSFYYNSGSSGSTSPDNWGPGYLQSAVGGSYSVTDYPMTHEEYSNYPSHSYIAKGAIQRPLGSPPPITMNSMFSPTVMPPNVAYGLCSPSSPPYNGYQFPFSPRMDDALFSGGDDNVPTLQSFTEMGNAVSSLHRHSPTQQMKYQMSPGTGGNNCCGFSS